MDSPVCVRRRLHFRSLSDVTPARRAHAPRARSHSERPGDHEARLSPPAPVARSPARRAHSERSSPNASPSLVSDEHARSDTDDRRAPRASRATRATRLRTHTVTIVGNPWRKMSEADLRDSHERTDPLRLSFDKAHADDPWIRDKGTYPKAPETKKGGNFNVFRGVSQNAEAPRPVGDAEPQRGKLERKSPVVCDSCGSESCECWRPRSPRCPRTPRQRRALSSPNASFEVAARKVSGKGEGGDAGAGLLCTCEPAARSPRPARPSPARLAPRPQPPPPPADVHHAICSDDVHGDINKPADPLLETTC